MIYSFIVCHLYSNQSLLSAFSTPFSPPSSSQAYHTQPLISFSLVLGGHSPCSHRSLLVTFIFAEYVLFWLTDVVRVHIFVFIFADGKTFSDSKT
jgi:hypothetical protein